MLTFEAIEVARVRAHLAGAEAEMVSRDVSHLSEAQRLCRALLLEELVAYREGGVFPTNPDFEVMTPYFIDADGVRCAMAHLLEVGGQAELVAKIARERNNAYVEELADEPGLLDWLDAAGITVAEAARIQPSYCPSSPASRYCAGTPSTVIEATVVRAGGFDQLTGRSEQTELRVNAVYGGQTPKPGNTIEAWVSPSKVGDAVVLRTSGDGTPTVLAFDENGQTRVSLTGWENEPSLALSKDKAIEAATSSNCEGVLENENPRWTENPNACESEGSLGCTMSPAAANGATALTLAIIATILAASARRLARRA